MAESPLHPFGHEPMAIGARRVLWVAAVVAVVVLIIIAALYWIVQRGMIPREARLAERVAAIPPAPRLQSHPRSDLVRLQEQQESLLSSYAWIDSTHAAARIPIERAMAIYVQEQSQPQARAPSAPAATPEPSQ